MFTEAECCLMNMLRGEIPESFRDLQGLTGVNLSHIQFNGTIPEGSFDRLKNLEALDLSHNQLIGEIPEDFASQDLSSNKFDGRIPIQDNFNTKYNQSAFTNNTGLCGNPLPDPCKGTPNIHANNTTRTRQQTRFYEFVSPWAFLVTYIVSVLAFVTLFSVLY